MEKIKKIYRDDTLHLEDLLGDKKATIILLGILVILVVGFFLYLTVFSYTAENNKLIDNLNNGISYLDQSKAVREEFLEKKISEEDFKDRSSKIQDEITKINKNLHSLNLGNESKIPEETPSSIGEALQGLVAIILKSDDVKSLDDEILAINIIITDVKTEVED